MSVAEAGTATVSIVNAAIDRYMKRVMASPYYLMRATIIEGFSGSCDALINSGAAAQFCGTRNRAVAAVDRLTSKRDLVKVSPYNGEFSMSHTLWIATRKGAFTLKSDASRRTWKLGGPQFLGHVLHHIVQDPRDPKVVLMAAKTGHLGPTLYRS